MMEPLESSPGVAPIARARTLLILLTVMLWVMFAAGQTPPYEADPHAFVQKAVQNELNSQRGESRYMWKQVSKKPKGTVSKLMIETTECIISRTIARDGHPLDAQERQQDDQRVERLLNDQDALRKKKQEQQDDTEHANRALRAIPDAFLFKFVGLEKNGNEELVHYTFEPNPNFDPPNREAMAFQGMKGDLFIDPASMHIIKIDATLFRDVPFGWGILGRLYKGGRFLIEQQKVGENRWETTHTVLSFTGKVLMFKSLNIQQDETLSEFRKVPDNLTIAQGINYLKKADAVVAEERPGNGN